MESGVEVASDSRPPPVNRGSATPVQGIPVTAPGALGEVTGIPVNPTDIGYAFPMPQQSYTPSDPWAGPRGMTSFSMDFEGPHVLQLELQTNHTLLLQLAKSVKWFAVLDCLLCLLRALSLGWNRRAYAGISLVVTIGPLLGYKGARTFRRNQVVVYCFFCVGNLTYRLAECIIAIQNSDPSLILSLLMVIIELYITRIAIRFWQLLKELTEDELAALRTYCGTVSGFVYW